MGVYIKGMEMPKNCYKCRMVDSCQHLWKPYDLDDYSDLQNMVEEGFTRADNCPLVEVPPHGRLIDADALAEDLKRQCKQVFKIDAVSPDDFWITRDQAYNERLWKTWCESFIGYLQTRPTVIEAEEGE